MSEKNTGDDLPFRSPTEQEDIDAAHEENDDRETDEMKEFITIVTQCGECEAQRLSSVLEELGYRLTLEGHRHVTLQLTNMILEATVGLFSGLLTLEEVRALAPGIRLAGVKQFNIFLEQFKATHANRELFRTALLTSGQKRATA